MKEPKLSKEPAIHIGAGASLIMGAFMIVAYFFPSILNDDTQRLVATVASTFGPLLIGYLIRRKVWSEATVIEMMDNLAKKSDSPS